MSLVRHFDEIPEGTQALECPRCRIRYLVDEIDTDHLVCGECSLGGLIPRADPKISKRFPHPLHLAFTPLPAAFFDPVAMSCVERTYDVDIEASDRAIIAVLESHRRPGRDWVWPGTETIASKAHLGEAAVRRRMAKLVDAGLIARDSRSRRGSDGRYDVVLYSLAPLWQALAHAVLLTAAAPPAEMEGGGRDTVTGRHGPSRRDDTTDRNGADQPPFRSSPPAKTAPEEEVVEEQPEEGPSGVADGDVGDGAA